MLNKKLKLNEDIFRLNSKTQSIRDGFGEGLLEAGKNKEVVVLCADLCDSVKADLFAKEYPERYFEVGISEQNMTGISAGMSFCGKIPFMISHAIFSPSRNWDQVRLSIALSKANVKIASSHSGFSNGKDGSVALSLEDISLMRVLPNITIIQPIDSIEAYKCAIEASKYKGPVYIRYSKASIPNITSKESPFVIGKAYVLKEGSDITLITSGPISYEVLLASKELEIKHKVSCEVVNIPTLKPLDEDTVINSVKKTHNAITIEEHQISGGLGSIISELLCEKYPTKLYRMGMEDSFGQSGEYKELLDKYKLSSHHIVSKVLNVLGIKKL